MNIFEYVAAGLAERADNPDAQIAWLEREIIDIERLEESLGVGMPQTKMTLLWNKALLLKAREPKEDVS